MIQFRELQDLNVHKIDLQINFVNTPSNNRNYYQSKRRIFQELKNNNLQEYKQKQAQLFNSIRKARKSDAQQRNFIISQKSYTSNKLPNSITNLNNNNNNNSWLNKYFIYRHESLNRYLINKDFRASLDRLSDNYKKQLSQYNNFYKQRNSSQINDKNIFFSKNNLIDNRSLNIQKNDKNNQKKKFFIVTGGYPDVVENLSIRGWERENNVKSIDFDYIWTLKTNEINFMLLKNHQLCNHFFRNGQITRKSGLSNNIKNLYYKDIDPMNFFPRCYDLSVKIELEDFKQDFKITWAMSLLKLFQKEALEKKNHVNSTKLTHEVITTAIKIVERYLFILENKGQYLNELMNNNNRVFLVSDEEWKIIYLQELTQTSNIQDIIYEVNSNKPGGANNPIKTTNNKTVPKRIIGNQNEDKNNLANNGRSQVGVKDANKVSPNLQSVSGFKSKISQMKKEEKKDNFNIEKKMSSNKLVNSNNILTTHKRINVRKIGASFREFEQKVFELLKRLEKSLPQYKLNGLQNIWILKPSNLSRGRGVTCVNSLYPIMQSLSATNDTGLIVQKYIENPLIIKNRKFDIRQWVLVTCLNPLTIWMWKEPYLRFGAEDYIMDDLNNIYSHLTNNSIAKHSTQFKNEKKFEGDMWTCKEFSDFIGERRWEEIHEKIKNAIICSFYAAHHEIKQRENSHELYGYDFMIDEDYNVYLIEVNASPALDYSTKITKDAVKDMVKDLIKLVIDYNNGRDYKIELYRGKPNDEIKFIQIFNESKDRITIPQNIPNKKLFY